MSASSEDAFRDILLWRRKKQSVMILSVATAIWVVMEVYKFSFITVASWGVMFMVASLFLWANILKLLGKEPPSMPGMVITEQTAMDTADSVKQMAEEALRWMFLVGAEKEWFVFAGAVAGLGLLSWVGTFFDLLTFLYTCTVLGMTGPVIYVNYEDHIRRYWERVMVQSRKYYDIYNAKLTERMKNKNTVVVEKEKKAE